MRGVALKFKKRYLCSLKRILMQPEILGKLISELLLFSRFFLNFPRPYIPIEWSNFLGEECLGNSYVVEKNLGVGMDFYIFFRL